MEESTYARTLRQVVEDVLWPYQGLSPDPEVDQRHMAVAEVLRRLPEEAYQKLLAKIDQFDWFIPSRWAGATVHPFPATVKKEGWAPYAAVLFLSPSLERWGTGPLVAAVAHELAHLALDHKLQVPREVYETQEAEAWELVRQWGFRREERQHKQFYERRARREEARTASSRRKKQ